MKGGKYMDRIDDRIKIVKDEVIDIQADVIINPTDEYFSGSYELDKLIQKNAGQTLSKKLSKHGVCQAGHCIIKKGYDISKATIKLNQQFYTGKEIEIDDIKDIQTAEIKLDGQKKSLVFGEHFVVVEGSYDKNIKKGTAKLTLKAAEDNEPGFGGSKTVTFKIAPQDVKDTWKGSF